MSTTKIPVPTELFAPAESSSFAGEYALPVFEAGPDTYRFPEPLRWSVQVTNTTGALLVTGDVVGVGTTECARCLDEFELDVEGSIEGFFVIEEEARPDDMEADEFEFLADDRIIDLEPLIKAAILVDLPLLPLCDEDCKGICQDCGANLNKVQCECAEERARLEAQEEAAANPFAALAQLKFEDDDSGNL